jgi:glycosyl transferase family 87
MEAKVIDVSARGVRSFAAFSPQRSTFWIALFLGAALRFYCVVFTEGTYDINDWTTHATGVRDHGLIGYYHANESANHPPFMLKAASLIQRASEAMGIPFRIIFRAPFALIDAGTALLLPALLREKSWRYLAMLTYWLSPVAIILSAFHGNTDCAIGFLLVLCLWFLAHRHERAAAFAFGATFWIKLPGILALPGLLVFFKSWRSRIVFLLIAGATALATYLPALVQDPLVVYRNVFGYHGLVLQTTAGVPVWGASTLLFSTFWPINAWPEKYLRIALFFLEHSWQISLALLLGLVWLRRHRSSLEEVAATIGMGYVIIYGVSDYWAFQYFAWSLPLWFFLPRWFFLPAFLLTSAYLYSLYWMLCGNGWLLGKWDFIGHPYWPGLVMAFRNLAFSFFLVSAGIFLISAMWRQGADTLADQATALE